MENGLRSIEAECPRQLSVTERLYQEKKILQARLEQIEKTILILEETPSVLAALDALSRLGIR